MILQSLVVVVVGGLRADEQVEYKIDKFWRLAVTQTFFFLPCIAITQEGLFI